MKCGLDAMPLFLQDNLLKFDFRRSFRLLFHAFQYERPCIAEILRMLGISEYQANFFAIN